MKPARIALIGISLESNRFAPPTREADFRVYGYFEGDAALEWFERAPEFSFAARLSELRDWEPVPVLIADGGAGGPCEHGFFLRLLARIRRALRLAAPLDGVFILGHGAGTTTRCDDLDGAYFQLVRDCVGPDAPIVALLDLHGKVSDAMFSAADALVAYRSNPHLDFAARARDCAEIIHDLLDRRPIYSALVRAPLITPQITQLTEPGEPMAELVDMAAGLCGHDVRSVSILPGFAFSDTPHNGLAVVAVGHEREAVRAAAGQVAQHAWDARDRFHRDTIDADEAARLALGAGCDPGKRMIFADVSDNPGGGGRGNTMWLLDAFHKAGVRGACFGMIYDPELVIDAAAAGIGQSFRACFNRSEPSCFSKSFEAQAVVVALTDGRFVGRLGVAQGQPIDLGRSTLLRIGDLLVAVASHRAQVLGVDYFEYAGVDISAVRSFVVKSRGHFRAGFEGIAPRDRIFEVSAPGLTTPEIAAIDWRDLPRPSYPLDPDVRWSPEPALRCATTRAGPIRAGRS